MKLLVAIVNYRVAQLVIDCLHSIAPEIDTVPGMRVAVCENGTGDDSAERIQQAIDDNGWGSWCGLTALSDNLGFTGGNNAIIAPAMALPAPPHYVLLLNPDTIVRPNAFKALVDFMDQNPKVGIAGSRLEDPDGTPQRSAFRFHSPFGEFEAGLKLGLVTRLLRRWVVAPPVRDHAFETDWVSGASMIIRRETIDATGLLDEGYFTYFDDIDYCFNARRHGWPTWYVPASRIVHLIGQSSGVNAQAKRLPAYLLEARRRYFLKNHGAIYAATADACMIVGQSLWRLRVLLTGRKDTSPPHLLADSIRHSVFLRGFKLSDVRARP
ncbi:glycosyltransferase family 2 protein [Bradyrhizobium lablabi]|uniref:glycosyltransferase family 2 protein n=1 Tax=Bradyrhizobium lablabi TaxID=722472 RepID=UPI001BABC654|nr:glycosyltransferase family 2 protein [Bradyrhizobium lablabi]MBR0697773.1 glycosyltransferase family 2 protein [Bradyrhizobium lablabi]